MATTVSSPKPKPVVDDETTLLPRKLVRARPLFDPEIVRALQAEITEFGLRAAPAVDRIFPRVSSARG